MKVASFALILLILGLSSSLKLPPGFKKCDKTSTNFDNCLSHAIQDAIKLLAQPHAEYGLPSLEPLVLPTNIEVGNNVGGVKQIYSNLTVHSLTKITDAKARFDFEANILSLKLTLDEFHATGNAHVFGNLLILPFDRTTNFYSNYSKAVYTFTFKLDTYEKDNSHYYKVVKTGLHIDMDKLDIGYTDLFENKDLNDAFNAELNANWKAIFDFVWKVYSAPFSELFGVLFNNLLAKVPIEEIFENVDA